MELNIPPGGYSVSMSKLCMWYMEKLNLINKKHDLLGTQEVIHCPKHFLDDTIILALALTKTYAQSIFRTKHLPLQLDFYLALTRANREAKQGATIDFTMYGFPDATKGPKKCMYHGMPSDAEAQQARRAFPNTPLACGPHVCTLGMADLYATFEMRLKRMPTAEERNKFKKELLEEFYGAAVATMYLRTLDFGHQDRILANPLGTMQVFAVKGKVEFSLEAHYAALFLLHKYRGSLNFKASKDALADIDLTSIYYVAYFIAMTVFHDNADIPASRAFFGHMGFPQPQTGGGKVVVCKHHSEIEDLGEARKDDCLVEKKMEKHKWVKMAGDIEDERMQMQGTEIEFTPGATSNTPARQYMGCDEGVVCTAGMVRLKDYLLAYAFDWDVNIYLNTALREFIEFKENLELRFAGATTL